MSRRTLLAVAATVVALSLSAGAVLATPGAGVISAPILARGTVPAPFKVAVDGLVRVKTKQPTDFVTQYVELEPGGHTGWHGHPGPAFVTIASGTLTYYDADDPSCTAHPYSAGSTFVDEGGGHQHIGRNESTSANVKLYVTYIVPVGAAPRTDVSPAPGNCPF